jgi:hypothetical protein
MPYRVPWKPPPEPKPKKPISDFAMMAIGWLMAIFLMGGIAVLCEGTFNYLVAGWLFIWCFAAIYLTSRAGSGG